MFSLSIVTSYSANSYHKCKCFHRVLYADYNVHESFFVDNVSQSHSHRTDVSGMHRTLQCFLSDVTLIQNLMTKLV